MSKKAILLLGGGIDSTTLLAKLTNENFKVLCLIFDYGQTLKKEIEYAINNAKLFKSEYQLIEIPLNKYLTNCSLLYREIIIEKNRTIEEIKKGTPTSYVPFRNGIFFAYAVAIGETNEITNIYCGGNGLNSGNYWDDSSEFARKFSEVGIEGTSPEYFPNIQMPFSNIEKWEIIKIGKELKVDYSLTWSCYEDTDVPCGICDSCIQRKLAFDYVEKIQNK